MFCLFMILLRPVRSRLRFSSKNVPFMNGSDVRPLQFSCEQRNTVNTPPPHPPPTPPPPLTGR